MKIHRFLIPTILACLLTAVYLTNISAVEFHPDESQWIASSKIFEDFLKARFSSTNFDETFLNVTQPPLARYFIGLGRRLGGYKWADLNHNWAYRYTYEKNVQRGALPSAGLLWWSRLPMSVLAVISIMIGFTLVKETAGLLAGFFWVVLNAISSYLMINLRRAMGESTLLFCVALAAILCYWILRMLGKPASIRVWKIWIGLGAVGVVAGAAAAAKLNGFSIVLVGMMLALVASMKLQRSITHKWGVGISAALLILLISILTFIGLYPFLWPDPVGRIQEMLDSRIIQMNGQQRIDPEHRLDSASERFRIIPLRIFQTYAAMSFEKSFFVNLLLFGVGVFCVLRKIWKSLSLGLVDPAPAAVILIGLVTAAPALLTPLDWDRYYLLPVFFTTFFIAIGAAAIATIAVQFAKQAYQHLLPEKQG